MAKGFRYEFTGNELFYLLFKEKKCLKCGGRMTKNKCAEIVDGIKFNTTSVPLYIKGREIKNYYYLFICDKCGSKFTLAELVK